MNCPACGHRLTPLTTGDLTIDACVDGCGGLWFDQFELKKVDEAHEAAGEALLSIMRQPGREPDRDKRHACPKCLDVVMMRHYASAKRQVMVDECPSCAGFWLDEGELAVIRAEFASQAEKEQHHPAEFEAVLSRGFGELKAESAADLERAQKFARMFKLLCPSNYVPGKQDWGAF